ncbi:helix-turn-helix domain-containing protein [Xanthocytophaga flava]|uniref:helix-turn-helix domain-containing protein n=1 Tax=Xanthocytophaga flava TaxID=3048013 RepID=UPI0028D02F9E|nr:helix-turn-helix transcriptional regulator [Xanthocytophaga flavus]MDJ1469267.1 helix-turn-helix transcriptional regulator [Xanthocytophaga flavus]
MAKEETTINEYHLNRHQPDKPQFAIHDLHEYLKKHQSNTTRPHIHSYYQIIWFKSGAGKHFVDFKEYEVLNNTLFFIAKNQVHYFDPNTHYKGFLLHFNETFLVQKDNETDFFLKYTIFNSPYQQSSCCMDKDMDSILEEYIRQIIRELKGEEAFGREELVRASLKSFLIQVQRRKNELEQADNIDSFTLNEKRVQLIKFVNLVDQHYTKGFSVAEYADLLFISSRTLSDITKQVLNKTPSQMIQERIILEAQRLLLHSNMNVNQIGYRLGFDDPSYFVKYFKKHTQLSPSEFRKSIS